MKVTEGDGARGTAPLGEGAPEVHRRGRMAVIWLGAERVTRSLAVWTLVRSSTAWSRTACCHAIATVRASDPAPRSHPAKLTRTRSKLADRSRRSLLGRVDVLLANGRIENVQ
jgi:hypothetical protein